MLAPPPIISLIRRCRKELASIGEHLGFLNETIRQNADSAKAAEERHGRDEESGESKRRVVSFDDQSKREDQANKDREFRLQNSIRWATWFAVIAASLYSFVAYRQYRELIDSTGAAQDAVHESRESRQEAQQAFHASVDQTHLDERAWVGVTLAGIVPSSKINAGDEFIVQIVVKNTGKTPSVETRPYIHWNILGPNDPLVAPGPKPTQSSINTFFPNSPFALNTAKMRFGDAQIPKLVAGTDVFRVWGEVEYEDIFQGKHWTHFCFYLATDLTNLIACHMYNETDDEKKNQTRNLSLRP
jgi:hypothetical protein